MPVDLRTIENVELVSTGTYALASGVTTFTEEDLAAAVEAASDPTVPAPRIKLGHVDPRFDEAVASGRLDGEPAFGVVANMHLSDDRQTILGDLVNVPAWLAESMPSSYPGRSIEGGLGFEAPSGRKYGLVISALALLGVTWPGVTSLDDLHEILEANGQAPADALELVTAGGSLERAVSIEAGLDLGSVQRQFVADLDEGEVPMPASAGEEGPAEVGSQMWWWPRSVRVEDDGSLVLIVDDDEGHLVRMPFTVNGNELEYGTPEVVVEQYVPVAAAAADVTPTAGRVLASWESRAAGRPVRASQPEDNTPMTEEQRRALAASLGLPEDTTEARLHEIAAARAAEHAETPSEGGDGGEPEPTPGDEPAPEAAAPAAVAASVPEGMVLVDRGTLDELRTGASAGIEARQRFDRADRDAVIEHAIRAEGRIAASTRSTWEQRWERDPDGTRALLTAEVEAGGLPRDVIPVAMREVGTSADGEIAASGGDADHDAFMARHFPQAAAKLAARHDSSGVRVRQEV